jgi:hypothetical protein
MTYLQDHRTHYCPDSGFSLVSENDAEFEVCHCFQGVMDRAPVFGSAESEAAPVRSSAVIAEQIWYRTISALAKVCGTAKAVHVEPVQEHESAQVPVTLRKS